MRFVFLIWHCVWFLRVALLVALSAVGVQREFYKSFPVFILYTCWTALESLVFLGMNYAPFVTGNEYAAAFTAGAAVDSILHFVIIREIFKYLLSGYPALRETGDSFFRVVTVVLLIAVVALAWLAPAAGTSHLMSGFFLLQRTVNVLLCGLLLFLFVFSGFFSLSWRSQAFGIALGLGILASVSLGTSAIRSQIEPIARNQAVEISELISQGAYLCSVLVWMVYLCLPERRSANKVKALPKHDLEIWNQELERLLHQ
jgi:hypothetical protein